MGFVALYSAGYSFPWRIEGQIRNIAVAAAAMLVVGLVPMKWVKNMSVPIYIVGVLLLLATLLFGVTIKGATRWLDIGVGRIQPLRDYENRSSSVYCLVLPGERRILAVVGLRDCCFLLGSSCGVNPQAA